MTDKDALKTARIQMRQFLPGAMWAALQSYRFFMMKERDVEESKKYGEHQKAGKIAIGHVDLLFNLAKKMEEDGELSGDDDSETLKSLMQLAKNSSDEYHAAHADDDLA